MWLKSLIGLAVVGGAIVATAIFSPNTLQSIGIPVKAANAPAAQTRAAAPVRSIPVIAAKAVAKQIPLRVDSLGSVQAIATVTIRSRVESQITEVLVNDGAVVKAGDILFKLDSRAINAQVKQIEATLARDKALLEQAERNVVRYQDLQAKQIGAKITLDDARSAAAAAAAVVKSDEAQLDNLKVQLTYYTIQAPIDGRIGSVGLKAGNIAKTGDASTPLAVINQFKPIYVAMAVPQRYLPDLRLALSKGDATVVAIPQGSTKPIEGKVAYVDNAFDPASGTVNVRGVFPNADESLWPGGLCTVRITLRNEQGISVPREAVQSSQNGTFVFVIEDNTAKVRPVTVSRNVDNEAVISAGLKGDETVVVDGQMQLINGTKVEIRTAAVQQKDPS